MDKFKTQFWLAKFTKHYPIIEKSVKRRFRNDQEKVEEALSYVSEKLLEDNMRRIALYDPKRGATFETYFTVLVQRLISRFIDQNHKPRRFPQWILKQGNFLWQMVYKLLCWERQSEADVVEYSKTSVLGHRDECIVIEAVQMIRELYPDCGKEDPPETPLEDENRAIHTNDSQYPSFHHLSPEDQMALGQLINLANAIYAEPDTDEIMDSDEAGEIAEIRKRLKEKFNPSPEKRLFLKMIYQDGMNVTHAGKMLGWNENQASGHHRRLMAQLKEILGDDFLI